MVMSGSNILEVDMSTTPFILTKIGMAKMKTILSNAQAREVKINEFGCSAKINDRQLLDQIVEKFCDISREHTRLEIVLQEK